MDENILNGLYHIYCDDEEAVVMASIDENVLDNLATDNKYSGEMEEALLAEYGRGLLTVEEEQKCNIPDYIDERDVAIWEAEAILYQASNENHDSSKRHK